MLKIIILHNNAYSLFGYIIYFIATVTMTEPNTLKLEN